MRKPRPPHLPPRFEFDALNELTAEWIVECGQRVRRRRELLQMHRRELADLAGTTEPTIIRIEAGKLNPRDGTRIAIAGALRCEVDSLWPYPSHAQVLARAGAVA